MEQFSNILQNPIISILGWGLGSIGWIFGIVSAVATLRSYFGQKKMERAYISVLEQAKLDWEGKYTENQIKELSEQFNKLQKQIQNDIPKQARRVLLENQLNSLIDSITTLYQQYKLIRQQIDELSSAKELDLPIKKAIEDEIMPNYLGHKRQQRGTQIMLMAIFILTIFPFFGELLIRNLYDFLYNSGLHIYSGDILAYVTGIIVSLVISFLFIPNKFVHMILRNKLKGAITSAILLISWVAILLEVIYEPIPLIRIAEIVGSIISLIPFSIGIWILYIIVSKIKVYRNSKAEM